MEWCPSAREGGCLRCPLGCSEATDGREIHCIARSGLRPDAHDSAGDQRTVREGDAFTMITPDDDAMVRTIERAVGQRIPRHTIAGFNYDAPPALPQQRQNGRQPARQDLQPHAASLGTSRSTSRPTTVHAHSRQAGPKAGRGASVAARGRLSQRERK